MLRVLNVAYRLNSGGVPALIYHNYKYMDHSKIQFDVVVQREKDATTEVEFFERKLMDMGVNVYHVPAKSEDLSENLKQMKKIMSDGHYDIVHVHMEEAAATYIYLAKKSGVKVRISHAHLAYPEITTKQRIIYKFLKVILKRYATHRFACGYDAGVSVWGEKAVAQGEVKVINNAVDTKGFAFSPAKREQARKDLGLTDEFIIGNVARLSYQKNHPFMLEIFAEISKREERSRLMLIGAGELEEEVRNKIAELHLEDKVLMLGERDDIPELMQAMDVFLLPSLYEGLPIVGVEAQAAGLPCFFADTITSRAKVIDAVEFMSLNQTAGEWAERILKYQSWSGRTDTSAVLKQNGYDLETEVKKLQQIYEKAVDEANK